MPLRRRRFAVLFVLATAGFVADPAFATVGGDALVFARVAEASVTGLRAMGGAVGELAGAPLRVGGFDGSDRPSAVARLTKCAAAGGGGEPPLSAGGI